MTGTFELHVFAAPLDPDPETAARFAAVCAAAGTRGGSTPLKGLLLGLDYQHRGFVLVMQTSRYCTGTLDEARLACSADAALLREAGFTVLREKVEAVASNEGVPDNDQDAASDAVADRYFEYHLLVNRVAEGVLTEEDHRMLHGIAADLSARFGTPVPLSYNAFKPGQRFLNARTYGLGRPASYARVAQIEDAVQKTGTLRVVKIIREYICADSNKGLDAGWLEPLPPPATDPAEP